MPAEFNEEELMDRVDGDIEFLEETIEILDEDYPPLFEEVVQAATAGDADALVKPAHAIKGMLSNFCAGPAGAAALELEQMARESKLTDVDTNVQALARETDRLRSALHQFLKAHQS